MQMNLFSFTLRGIERSHDSEISELKLTAKWFPLIFKLIC